MLSLAGVESAIDHDAVLVMSELVTNAATHGRGPVGVELSVNALSVTVAVSDSGAADPARQHPGLLSEGGRGLGIVDRLVTNWRVEHEGAQKTVIATLPTVPSAHAVDWLGIS